MKLHSHISSLKSKATSPQNRISRTHLVLDIAPITPLIDPHPDLILPLLIHILRDIELAGISRSLGVPNLLAVDEDMEGRVDSLRTIEGISGWLRRACTRRWNSPRTAIVTGHL